MAASLDDILTTQRNGVINLANLAETWLQINGKQNASALTSATLVKTGAGRIASVSVVVGGSATGAIYDAGSASATSGILYTIPTTVGVYVLNFPFVNGLVVAPGTGQTIAVSYS